MGEPISPNPICYMSKLMKEMTLPRKQSLNINRLIFKPRKEEEEEEETKKNCMNIIQSRGREHLINHRELVESELKIKYKRLKRRDGIKSHK